MGGFCLVVMKSPLPMWLPSLTVQGGIGDYELLWTSVICIIGDYQLLWTLVIWIAGRIISREQVSCAVQD